MQAFYVRHASRVPPAKEQFRSVLEARTFVVSFFLVCLGLSAPALLVIFADFILNHEILNPRSTFVRVVGPFWFFLAIILGIVTVMFILVVLFLPQTPRGQMWSLKKSFRKAVEIARWTRWLSHGYYALYVTIALYVSIALWAVVVINFGS